MLDDVQRLSEKRARLRRLLARKEPRFDHAGPLPLARGEVVGQEGWRTLLAARDAFLKVAGDVQPEILVDLAGAPFDAYVEAVLAHRAGDPDPESRIHDEGGAVWAWCEKWRFPISRDSNPWPIGVERRWSPTMATHDGWGQTLAAMTLRAWCREPLPGTAKIRLVLPFDVERDTYDADGDLGLEQMLRLSELVWLPGLVWDPQLTTKHAIREWIMNQLERAVDAELDRIEEAARMWSVPPAVKRTGKEHLVWLARYQYRGESYDTIADAVCKNHPSVAQAVRETAELVGIELREKGRPGRPRKHPAPPAPSA